MEPNSTEQRIEQLQILAQQLEEQNIPNRPLKL